MKFETGSIFDIDGTGLVGYVAVAYVDLVEVFGQPHNSDVHKSDAEWVVKFENGTVATIYNYKDGVNYLGPEEGTPVEDIRDWHVGGTSSAALALVTAALNA